MRAFCMLKSVIFTVHVNAIVSPAKVTVFIYPRICKHPISYTHTCLNAMYRFLGGPSRADAPNQKWLCYPPVYTYSILLLSN